MERIRLHDGKAVLTFNHKFYGKQYILSAVDDFKPVCDISEDGDRLILKPKGKENPEILALEFYNYVLGLMKNN